MGDSTKTICRVTPYIYVLQSKAVFLEQLTTFREDWVARLQNRDQVAFTQLYYNYSNTFLGIISRIVKDDQELAKDVLQEAMVKIWNNIESYDPSRGTLFTWMLNICRNMAIDKTRSKLYRNQRLNQSLEINPVLENRLQDLPRTETIGVRKMIETLDPTLREVVDAVYIMGYTHAEASEKLHIPLGTVKTRLRNAIVELRKYFN
jgi:RNA polymerase sigma factor (sigma-70 family)